MLWDNIVGQTELIDQLKATIKDGRISHAQLFIAPEGVGALPLAIAYAQHILCPDSTASCTQKVVHLQHPDLHFSYPYNKVSASDGQHPVATKYIGLWRNFVLENSYGNYSDWMKFLGIEKKQGIINVHEANDIIKRLTLNSYEGGYKVMIIWHADLMNEDAANKLLKVIEEPPQRTIFILIAEKQDAILPTILSRCQVVNIPHLTDAAVEKYLVEQENIPRELAKQFAFMAQGNLRVAKQLATEDHSLYDTYFVSMVRLAFLAKKKLSALREIILWANEISLWSRDEQKNFLIHSSEIYRQALLKNYQADEISYLQVKSDSFKWAGFFPYINSRNIEDILTELNEAAYHIERNGNAKIIFFDMAVKLTRFIHRVER